MYISTDGSRSIDIEQLSATTSKDISWNHGYQDEDVIKIQFEIEPDLERFTLKDPIQKLCSDIHSETEFLLTGIKYDIYEHSGELVFSSLKNIRPSKQVNEQLANNPPTMTVPCTIAQDGVVTCTGAFTSFFDWGYSLYKIKFKRNDGMYITAADTDGYMEN